MTAYAAFVPTPTRAEARYGDHERNVLDFWQAPSERPTPLVLVIHGGSWTGNNKETVHRSVDVNALLKEGISVAAINYRYISQATREGIEPPVKAPLYDAARALQFIRSKAREWNLDKERMGAAGVSAGGCSALWLAYRDDLADAGSEDPVARESTRLWCAAVASAQTTLDPQQMKDWTPNSRYGGHAFGKRDFAEFLAARGSLLPWIAEYSPWALVSADDPPVYLSYRNPPALGQEEKDPTHTANFGVKLQERCREMGTDCELAYPGATGATHKSPTDYLIAILKAPADSSRR
ncbi:MAG: alpha/beta hydrolase [Candidatus Brocadiaceae bacterium]|nr:alpha/beta hydrolase [Candidatus Brocadiaceae bacterium]